MNRNGVSGWSGKRRWLSRDPLGESAGVNLYAYVGNNPVSKVDPLGLQALDWSGGNRDFANTLSGFGYGPTRPIPSSTQFITDIPFTQFLTDAPPGLSVLNAHGQISYLSGTAAGQNPVDYNKLTGLTPLSVIKGCHTARPYDAFGHTTSGDIANANNIFTIGYTGDVYPETDISPGNRAVLFGPNGMPTGQSWSVPMSQSDWAQAQAAVAAGRRR